MSIFDWFKNKIPPPPQERKPSKLEQAVLCWDPLDPKFNYAAKIPWGHFISTITYCSAGDVPAKWVVDGVPVGELAHNPEQLMGRFPGRDPLTILLKLLSWEEARPLVIDWFSRAVVIAGKESDAEAMTMLGLLANAKDSRNQVATTSGWWGGSYTCSIDGEWPIVLALGQNIAHSVNTSGWFSAANLLVEPFGQFPRFLAYGVVRARFPSVEDVHGLAEGEKSLVARGMLGQTCATLSAAYSRPRLPPYWPQAYETHIQRIRERITSHENNLAESRNDLRRAEATFADLTKQFATTEPGKTT